MSGTLVPLDASRRDLIAAPEPEQHDLAPAALAASLQALVAASANGTRAARLHVRVIPTAHGNEVIVDFDSR